MYRKIINDGLNEMLAGFGKDDVAISFSGGSDSTCLLFSLLELGFNPVLYNYHVEGVFSEDKKRAEIIASQFGLKLVKCPIPYSIDILKDDIFRLIKIGVRGKVCIQCCHGHLYVAEKLTENVIVNGSGIDGLIGSYTNIIRRPEISKEDNKELFDEERQKHLDNTNDDAMLDQQAIYSNRCVFPFRTEKMINALMSRSWRELNKPRLKYAVVSEYPEFKRLPKGYYRDRGSQQIMAGTRDFHDLLLGSDLNVNGWQSVVGIYNYMEKIYNANKIR